MSNDQKGPITWVGAHFDSSGASCLPIRWPYPTGRMRLFNLTTRLVHSVRASDRMGRRTIPYVPAGATGWKARDHK